MRPRGGAAFLLFFGGGVFAAPFVRRRGDVWCCFRGGGGFVAPFRLTGRGCFFWGGALPFSRRRANLLFPLPFVRGGDVFWGSPLPFSGGKSALFYFTVHSGPADGRNGTSQRPPPVAFGGTDPRKSRFTTKNVRHGGGHCPPPCRPPAKKAAATVPRFRYVRRRADRSRSPEYPQVSPQSGR